MNQTVLMAPPGSKPLRQAAGGARLKDRTTLLDQAIGAKVRAAREAAGLSQQQLAAALGITFQQVQKYEKGGNRVGAGTLILIAAALGRPVSAFLPETSMSLAPDVAAVKGALRSGYAELERARALFDKAMAALGSAETLLRQGDRIAAGLPEAKAS